MDQIKLVFAGDFIPPQSSENIFSKELQKFLSDKDFSIVNLEAPLTNENKKIYKTGNNFKVSTGGVVHIKNGSFNAVSLSNNHIRDFGCKGVNETILTCKQNNVLTVGAGENMKEASTPLRVTLKGQKVSFLNYSEREFNIATRNKAGANPFNLIDVIHQLKIEKTKSDFIILIYHGGLEYHHLPKPEIVKLFKFLVEAGADCIVSHHTHRYSGTILYQGKPIIFGLGNFLSPTKSKANDDWLIGTMASVSLNAESISFEIIPIKMSDDFYKVEILFEKEKQTVLDNISEISSTIENEVALENYWNTANELAVHNILNILKSDSQFEYRCRKYLTKVFHPRISDYKLLSLLNMVRCESHRERLVSVLESLYIKKQKVHVDN